MDINVRKAMTQGDSPEAQRITVNVWPTDSVELRAIMTRHFPAWAELFGRKNAEYQDDNGTAFVLGQRGQFSDMYRKMMKLKAAMWDQREEQLTSEGVDEIIMDLIGHCFLTLEMRSRERGDIPGVLEFEIPEDFGARPMSTEEFRAMAERAGLYVIDELDAVPVPEKPADPTQPTESELEAAAKLAGTDFAGAKGFADHLGNTWRVGETVRLKQHLGKGSQLEIKDVRDHPSGLTILLAQPNLDLSLQDAKAIWAHPAWLVKNGQKSVEEQALEASLDQRKPKQEFFGDNVNRDLPDDELEEDDADDLLEED